MKKVPSKSIVRGALLATVAASISIAGIQAGCSSTPAFQTTEPSTAPVQGSGGGAKDSLGAVGVDLTIPGGGQLNALSWTITGPSGASTVVDTGTVNVQNSLTISFLVGGIPAASGYTIALNGTSADGTTTCLGSATFSTTARATTNVSLTVQCNTPVSEAGSVAVSGTAYSCASISSISVSPAETTVGNSAALTSTATGPSVDGGTSITYAWSASTGSDGGILGTFDTPSSPNANFTCAQVGVVTVTLTVADGPVPDGGSCNPALTTQTVQIQCDPAPTTQALYTTVEAGVLPTAVTINQGTGIGGGTGATPFMLTNLAANPSNTQTITSNDGGAPFLATGSVPDTAYGFCSYPADGGATRITHVTGTSFETAQTDPMVPLAPAYFPLVYTSANTTSGNAFGGKSPIIGLFDWRPKDIDEGLLAAESDDNGKTWYFMQLVLELDPDYTNPVSGGYSSTSTDTDCPATVTSTNANLTSVSGSQDDDGWGHATIIQLPGPHQSRAVPLHARSKHQRHPRYDDRNRRW